LFFGWSFSNSGYPKIKNYGVLFQNRHIKNYSILQNLAGQKMLGI
jgi:hypothetical protein